MDVARASGEFEVEVGVALDEDVFVDKVEDAEVRGSFFTAFRLIVEFLSLLLPVLICLNRL